MQLRAVCEEVEATNATFQSVCQHVEQRVSV